MNRLDRGLAGDPLLSDEIKISPAPSVTWFFREPSALVTITDNLVPLFGSDVSVASIGCSSGEEVYGLLSVGMQRGVLERMRVDGYDYNVNNVTRGLVGIYGSELYKVRGPIGDDIRQLMEKEVLPDEPNSFQMPQALRERATFTLLDISQGPLPRRYPIALCANMLYHYVNPNRGRTPLVAVLDNIADSVTPGGFLVCEAKGTYQRSYADEYERALTSHRAFQERQGLALPYTLPTGKITEARVLQHVV